MALRNIFWFDSFYVAWRYVIFNWGRGLTLVACVTLIAVLPLSLELLLHESERQLLSRAETNPLVIGAKGSSLDLVMNSLYFGDTAPELISMAASNWTTPSGITSQVALEPTKMCIPISISGSPLTHPSVMP